MFPKNKIEQWTKLNWNEDYKVKILFDEHLEIREQTCQKLYVCKIPSSKDFPTCLCEFSAWNREFSLLLSKVGKPANTYLTNATLRGLRSRAERSEIKSVVTTTPPSSTASPMTWFSLLFIFSWKFPKTHRGTALCETVASQQKLRPASWSWIQFSSVAQTAEIMKNLTGIRKWPKSTWVKRPKERKGRTFGATFCVLSPQRFWSPIFKVRQNKLSN